MKILFLAASLEEGHAGASHHSVEFINALASRSDVQLTVLASATTDRLHPAAKLVLYRWPSTLRALWRLESLLETRRLASELRRHALPDVDVCYTRSTRLGLAFRSIVPTVPIVSQIGSVIASRETFEETTGPRSNEWHTRLAARLADVHEKRSYDAKRWLHLVSTPMVADVRVRVHNLPPDFFHVCPLGASVKRFDRAASHSDIRAALNIPPSAYVLLSVARLVGWKNIDLVVRALAALRRNDAYLIVVGGGPELENLRQLAVECGVAERTRFVGQIDAPAPYYAGSDVFVLPSRIESFGNVYAEAMLMGVPCIGMKHHPPEVLSSAEDVIPEGIAGYCVADLQELIARLNLLGEDAALRRTLGEAAFQHALKHYTIERYTETVLGLMRNNLGIQ